MSELACTYVLARHDHLEERPVRDEEEDAERAGQERHDIELRPGKLAEGVGEWDRRDAEAAQDVRRQHHLPAAAATVDPGARVQ